MKTKNLLSWEFYLMESWKLKIENEDEELYSVESSLMETWKFIRLKVLFNGKWITVYMDSRIIKSFMLESCSFLFTQNYGQCHTKLGTAPFLVIQNGRLCQLWGFSISHFFSFSSFKLYLLCFLSLFCFPYSPLHHHVLPNHEFDDSHVADVFYRNIHRVVILVEAYQLNVIFLFWTVDVFYR